MGISERREREREQRRRDILDAAWKVAQEGGWAAFSVERVAAQAELGRATVYGYFDSLETLVETMAERALVDLSARISAAPGLTESLDAPVRFSQHNPAAFSLLFPTAADPRPGFSSKALDRSRQEAGRMLGALRRLTARAAVDAGGAPARGHGRLPADARAAEAFLAGIAMAGATVPELRSSTTLRRRWQDFCLDGPGAKPADPGAPKAGDDGEGEGGAITPDVRRIPDR